MPDGELWLPSGVERASGRPPGLDDAALARSLREGTLHSAASAALQRGSTDGPADDSQAKSDMALMRRMATAARIGGVGGPGGLTMATARPRDPMFYWEQNNLPYRWDDPEGIKKIRKYARMLYLTHPIIASAIDIYSQWPMQDMELSCKDPSVKDFYTELFMEQLDWAEFAVDFGREYWTVGEGVSLGSFNEVLGVWEEDELIDPDSVDVITSPFYREPRFEMKLPESIREVLKGNDPKRKWEYDALMRSYPELRAFVDDDARMPVSNVLMRRIKFKGHNFSERGLPILMRAFRTLLQEEMLNAAFDAVADRLYTPLILVRLGASATDLGTSRAWVPTQADIAEFEASMDGALAADFRVLTSHFATDITSVFGREMLPRAEQDFQRIDSRLLQVFGISQTMLSGANKGETYAADALNFELVSQLLSRYQKLQKRHFRERALVVAEAQGHYDYEVRGGKRYPIMEEIVETMEDGTQRIVERPKLLVPDMTIRVMNMQAEKDQRMLIEALHASGVPISTKRRLTNVPVDLDEERELKIKEQVDDAIAAQEARKATYMALKARRLPIPQDLRDDFDPKPVPEDGQEAGTEVEQQRLPSVGLDVPTDNQALVPSDDLSGTGRDQGSGGGAHSPRNRWLQPMNPSRPPQSDERRGDMPKAASLGPRLAVRGEILVPPTPLTLDAAVLKVDASGNFERDEEGRLVRLKGAGPLQYGPSHIGRRLALKKDEELGPQIKEAFGEDAWGAADPTPDPEPDATIEVQPDIQAATEEPDPEVGPSREDVA